MQEDTGRVRPVEPRNVHQCHPPECCISSAQAVHGLDVPPDVAARPPQHKPVLSDFDGQNLRLGQSLGLLGGVIGGPAEILPATTPSPFGPQRGRDEQDQEHKGAKPGSHRL